MNIKQLIKKIPLLGAVARYCYSKYLTKSKFNNSREYWERRYAEGGNSGDGSYSKLAEFKADYINNFVAMHGIYSVIEYGVGDGNQLALAKYPSYVGFDVSAVAIDRCRNIFQNEKNKSFKVVDEYNNERAELTLSLDVIYHLVEDEVFYSYMRRLFLSSDRYVIIYSSNAADADFDNKTPHVKHRVFSKWIEEHAQNWQLIDHKKNKYPYDPRDNAAGSFADFYAYEKLGTNSDFPPSRFSAKE